MELPPKNYIESWGQTLGISFLTSRSWPASLQVQPPPASKSKNSNLGYIVKNSKLIEVLIKQLKNMKNISIKEGASISSISFNDSKILSFSKNEIISSDMIVAADGKNSAIRKILRTNVFKKQYNEKALVINLYHEKPHNNIAYEFFFKTGPLAILPMQTENNNFQSALVWSNKSNLLSNQVPIINLKKHS